jgi:sulfur relay (sulfurtransferase) complex TusBCD TusD component (DsrE family)
MLSTTEEKQNENQEINKNKNSKKNILFIIHTDKEEEINFVKELSAKLKEKGAQIHFFLMSRGVKFAHKFQRENTALCSRNASEFSLNQNDLPFINFASQYELSYMIENSDNIIAFC